MFPHTLEELISLKGKGAVFIARSFKIDTLPGDTVRQLLQEYGIVEVSEHRESNVNEFMQFCGVVYQLVRHGS